MKKNGASRLSVLKTYKIYINGQFPRTESGRYYPLVNGKDTPIANVCLSSRKDVRDAITAARGAFPGWAKRSAMNRGQIIYRIGEILEQRRHEFVEEGIRQGQTSAQALREVEQAIDRIIYYAGWADKYQQVFSSVNPVASSHFDFSMLEPTGVVAIAAPERSPLLGLVSLLMPAITGGNTTVLLASYSYPLSAITFAEVLNTSDVPVGVVNILTGTRSELIPHLSSHMDVNAFVHAEGDGEERKLAETNCALNVKRYHSIESFASHDPYLIAALQEVKTTWHPIGQ